jgi:PadR family transcriptional regulator, regulatory protein PadR
MKGSNLGELEELVLLTTASLVSEAYSVSICDELEKRTGRNPRLGMVHAVLNRLEEKGFVKSKLGDATSERGGKRKRFYTLTSAGKSVLLRAREIREDLWASIPPLAIRKI